MGIVAALTQSLISSKPVPQNVVKSDDIAAFGRVSIEYFTMPSTCPSLIYQRLPSIAAEDATAPLGILWKTSLLHQAKRLAWSSMMQMRHLCNHSGQSSVSFLPLIDLKSSDPSCI